MFVFSYILAFAAGQRPALNLVPVGGSFATLGYCTRFACLTSLIPYIQYISQLFPLSHILNTIYPIHLIYPIYPRWFNPEKIAQIRTTVNKYIYPILLEIPGKMPPGVKTMCGALLKRGFGSVQGMMLECV